METFEELVETYKIAKLLKDGGSTSKEAKEKLNEAVTLVNAYVVAVLKHTCGGKEVGEEDVERVFRSLGV